jgi:TPR repeat protein
MKKFLMVFIMCIFSYLSASDINNITGASSLIQEMDQVAKINPEQGNLMKAMLYEYGYEQENIEKDINKALEYYLKAFHEQNPIAAFKLGIYAWGYEQQKDKNTNKPLEYFLAAKDFKPKEHARLNMVAAGMYLYQKKEYLAVINVLKEATEEHEPTAEFYTALSYYALGEKGMANIYLTKACTNKKRAKDIDSFCNGNDNIEKIDLKEQSNLNNFGVGSEESYSACLG